MLVDLFPLHLVLLCKDLRLIKDDRSEGDQLKSALQSVSSVACNCICISGRFVLDVVNMQPGRGMVWRVSASILDLLWKEKMLHKSQGSEGGDKS